jgi:preprotein translocase subunit YajC
LVKEILIGLIVFVVGGLILYYLTDLRPKKKQKKNEQKERERQAKIEKLNEILSPSPIFGQEKSFFKVEYGPDVNDFINSFPMSKIRALESRYKLV